MIPYKSQHLSLAKLIKAVSISDARERTVEYFRTLTEKEYILPTSSCRYALFLAYHSLGSGLGVLTSPLTCTAAIDPIIYSGNNLYFSDISTETLNIDPDKIDKLPDEISVIQVIHLGGIPVDMDKILFLSRKYNLTVIEDCAQSFRASFHGEYTGSFGDISCFSLAKNAYGIGGGVLATDNYQLYSQAKKLDDKHKASNLLLVYRLLRNLLESKRDNSILDRTYNFLMDRKNKFITDGSKSAKKEFRRYLSEPRELLYKIFAAQIPELERIHVKTRKKAIRLLELLSENGLMENYKTIPEKYISPSFTKFFVYSPRIKSKEHIPALNSLGVEAKHLEQRHGSYYQDRVDSIDRFARAKFVGGRASYNEVHDSLVSLPLYSSMSEKDSHKIVKDLTSVINE